MAALDDLPAGWRVWNAEAGGRVVLAYRPDVFDGSAFPASCLPTLTVGPGRSPDDRPDTRRRSGRWYVALYLEPDVRVRAVDADFDDRNAAVDQAVELAARFAAGAIDYRDAYHSPRSAYLDALDDLIDAAE